MLSSSLNILLNRTEGKEITERIERIVSGVNEVEGFDETGEDRIKVFRLGKSVLVNIKLYLAPTLSTAGFYEIKKALKKLIAAAIPDEEHIILIRPSIHSAAVSKEIVALRSLDREGGAIDGVMAEHPGQASQWVLIESLDGAARTIRRVRSPGEGEDLVDCCDSLDAERILLSETGAPEGERDAGPGAPCVRVPFLTLRDWFH